MKNCFYNICLFVSRDVADIEVFGKALNDVSPETMYCVATSGQEGLDMITKGNFIPDVAFVELDMPHMDGIEFIKRLKNYSLYQSIPVIVHTKLSSQHRHFEILDAGALAIYPKEYDYVGVYNVLSLYCHPQLAVLQLN